MFFEMNIPIVGSNLYHADHYLHQIRLKHLDSEIYTPYQFISICHKVFHFSVVAFFPPPTNYLAVSARSEHIHIFSIISFQIIGHLQV